MTITASTTGKDLATLFEAGAVGLLPDAELLSRFAEGRGGAMSEAAFGALVARHGPLVLGVCRRVLGNDDHAAADAFQATFLVLARKGGAIRVDDSLGRWLRGVSLRVARRCRAVKQAEAARTRPLDGIDPPAADRSAFEVRESIDEEVARLPEPYRSAVVLCYLEGLTQEQAASRLGCPVGTIQSRLHRARERLRPALLRRGLAPAAPWTLATLAGRPQVPPALASDTLIAATTRLSSGKTLAGTVPPGVAALVHHTLRGMLMTKGTTAALILMTLGFSAAGAGLIARAGAQEPKPAPAPAPAPATVPPRPEEKPEPPPIADRLKQILAEYQAKMDAMQAAQEKVQTQQEWSQIYARMAPDDVTFCRRVVDVAATNPKDPAARDALVWVINKPGQRDMNAYGDEFARAAALLVRHHGDDPEAVRVALQLDNLVSTHRDELLTGFLASAKSRESKGMARLALGQYLAVKGKIVAGARRGDGKRQTYTYPGVIGEDGKPREMKVEQTDEEYTYALQLRLADPDAILAESDRLLNEVVADYADVPYANLQLKKLVELFKDPNPTWNGKPLPPEQLKQLKAIAESKYTLGQVARARLDEMHNLVPGKPAPEIDGLDVEGKSLKLSDYRGKVVVLVFWGSWCGPCMMQVPQERELAGRLKGKPFALLGVNCNETKDAALKAVKAEGMTWPSWHDGDNSGGPIASRYHVRSYPTVVVIDARGAIRANQMIFGEHLDKLVDDLLKEQEAGGKPEVAGK